jgi:hypothetical protein
MTGRMAARAPGEVGAVLRQLPAEVGPLLLYGSVARGDAGPGSDVDLLLVAARVPRVVLPQRVSLTCYSAERLEAMCRTGSLFAWHLRTEGVPLRGRTELERILGLHPGPQTERARERIRRLGAILDVRSSEEQFLGVIHVARFLLRTALYSRSIDVGEGSFSVFQAASALGRPEVAQLLALDSVDDAGYLRQMRYEIESLIGAPLSPNVFGSLEALSVRTWTSDRELSLLAIQALTLEDGSELDYEILEPVVL